MEERLFQTQRVELTINNSSIYIDVLHGRIKPSLCLLGPELTYTDLAAAKILGDQRHKKTRETFLKSNPEVVRAVDNLQNDLGIVAVENSTEGDVTEPLRQLVRTKNTRILGEHIMPIQHMLIGFPDQEIDEILSHAQALAQCARVLSLEFPYVKLLQRGSTALAVEEIMTKRNAAAIGGREIALKHNLPILRENIGDNTRNSTRFLLIGRGETEPTGDDTTTIVFVTKEDRRAILRDCLTVFAENDINLTKIDSYPHPTGEMRKYMFLVSHDGHEKDSNVQSAHDILRNTYCDNVRVLGSYKKALIPEGSLEPGAINDH